MLPFSWWCHIINWFTLEMTRVRSKRIVSLKILKPVGFLHSALRVKPYKAHTNIYCKTIRFDFHRKNKTRYFQKAASLAFFFVSARSLLRRSSSRVLLCLFISFLSIRAQSVTDSIILNTFLNPSHTIYLQWRICSSGAVDVRV